MSELTTGFTVIDVAGRYRVGPDKVRGWIMRGELRAINTAASKCAKPRFVVPADALKDFELQRAVGQPKPAKRRKTQKGMIDFFADC